MINPNNSITSIVLSSMDGTTAGSKGEERSDGVISLWNKGLNEKPGKRKKLDRESFGLQTLLNDPRK